MKSSIIFFGLGVALTLGAASCSVVKKVTDRFEHPKSMTVSNTNGKVSIDKKSDGKGPEAKAVVRDNPGVPSAEELTGGRWVISAVGNQEIEAEDDAPYVHFGRDGRFYGSDGCNIINGAYLLRNDGTMAFSGVLSTMKYCPEVEYAPLIGQVLNDESAVTVDSQRIGQDTYLYFKNKAGKVVMTLRRHNMEFLNGNWQVTSIDGKEIEDSEANIFFDVAELKVHGNTGCNFFNGQLYFDPSRSNALDISNMGVTRMACPNTKQETAMLVALEQTATAIAGDEEENVVMLLNSEGKELMTLHRLPIGGVDQN